RRAGGAQAGRPLWRRAWPDPALLAWSGNDGGSHGTPSRIAWKNSAGQSETLNGTVRRAIARTSRMRAARTTGHGKQDAFRTAAPAGRLWVEGRAEGQECRQGHLAFPECPERPRLVGDPAIRSARA